jgi:hypothetical protein
VETRKILMSRNFCYLDPPKDDPPPEGIMVAPDVLHKGELRESMLPSSRPKGNESKGIEMPKDKEPGIISKHSKRKQPDNEEEIDLENVLIIVT